MSLVAIFVITATAQSADYSLDSVKGPPDKIAADIKTLLSDEGYRVSGPNEELCDIWLVKAPVQKDGFSPSLRVKYPFEVGALVGVLRVGDQGEVADFRDQVILPGAYTLRYGQQPQDGNHIGTSQQADFLLALPADEDKSAKKLGDPNELNAISADAAGSSHPAIFSLLPSEKKPEQTKLTHEQDHDFWILETAATEKRPALRLVVVGFGEQ